MDKLFDVLNSSSLTDTNIYRRPLDARRPSIFEFIEESIIWLDTLRVHRRADLGGWELGSDATNVQRWIKGLKMTLRAVTLLHFDLFNEKLLTFLKTRRLGTDPLENAFAVMRAQGGNNKNPNPHQMGNVFRFVACF